MNDPVDSSPQVATPKKVNIVRRVLRGIAAVFRFLRVSVANILLVIIFIFVLGFLFSSPEVSVKPGSVLVFTPKASLVEQRPNTNPFLELLFGSTTMGVSDVHEVVSTLEHAATNPRIHTLEIRPDNLGGLSLTHLDLIGEALKTFSESGKPIYAYSENLSQSAYLLSSYADEIYLNPLGSLTFSGLAFESMYYKTVLDKLDINVHTFRSGEYKSAVEPFMLNSMSDLVRDSYRPIIDQLWSSHKLKIEQNRELEQSIVEQFTERVADLLVPNRNTLGELALENGFVDDLLTSDNLDAAVKLRFGLNLVDKPPSRISIEEYYTTIKRQIDLGVVQELKDETEAQSNRRGSIAVVTVEGTILNWTADDDFQLVDSTGAVEHIRHAMDEEVDAIVLRINSPGGSVTASEAIRLQIEVAKNQNIPIVASMSGTAASGGYWIAAGTDHIVAADSTITGSIGVFSMIPSVEKLLERIGVNNDGVYSSDGHFRLDLGAGISETEARMLQASVDDAYSRFLEIVSTGRGMTIDEVDSIAGGRIWTGRQALENGLVDELGDYDNSIEIAARLAGLSSYVVKRYGFVRRPPFLNLLAQTTNWTPRLTPYSSRFVQHVKDTWKDLENQLLIEPKIVYALCEICPDF